MFSFTDNTYQHVKYVLKNNGEVRQVIQQEYIEPQITDFTEALQVIAAIKAK